MNDQWLMILGVVFSVFAVIGVGGAMRQVGWLTEEADQSLLRLIVRLLLPCLVFSVVSVSPTLRVPQNIIIPPAAGFGSVALGLGLGLLVARLAGPWAGLRDGRQQRSFALCVGVFNYGFVPIPLVKLLYDDATLGVLFVYNVGTELAIWTLGVMLISGGLTRDWWRKCINPPSVSIVLALGYNFLDLSARLPAFADDVLRRGVDLIGQAAIPVSLLVVGATIADELRRDRRGHDRSAGVRQVGWSILLRLALLPAAFVALALVVPGTELKRVLVIQAAMPAAVFPIVMTRLYGGDPATGLRVVLATSLASLVTTPLWITLGMMWLGGGVAVGG